MSLGFQALTGDITSWAALNARRYTYYSAPSGAATLVGLLSIAESEPTDGPSFFWHEDRLTEKTALTLDMSDGSAGPWQNGLGAGGATFSFTAGDEAKLRVSSNQPIGNWQVGERLKIQQQVDAAGTGKNMVSARIIAITEQTATTGIFTVVIQETVTVRNSANSDEGMLVQSAGTPMAEGSRAPKGNSTIFPIQPGNYTEIFRHSAKFSRTVLNQPLFYDAAGVYRGKMRRTAMNHLIEMENAVMFGNREQNTLIDDDGSPTIVREMGGILWFLKQYESANGGVFGYRPGGAAVTAIGDDAKRIIRGSSGAISNANWRLIEERMFRTSMQSSNEKLVLGGSGFVRALLNYYRANAGGTITVNRGFDEDMKLSFGLTSVTTDYGTFHVKSHPRFNDQMALRNSGFVLDVGNIKLRPMVGADMHMREDIGGKKFDGRMDEYLTEIGLEVNFPETHMYFDEVSTIQSA